MPATPARPPQRCPDPSLSFMGLKSSVVVVEKPASHVACVPPSSQVASVAYGRGRVPRTSCRRARTPSRSGGCASSCESAERACRASARLMLKLFVHSFGRSAMFPSTARCPRRCPYTVEGLRRVDEAAGPSSSPSRGCGLRPARRGRTGAAGRRQPNIEQFTANTGRPGSGSSCCRAAATPPGPPGLADRGADEVLADAGAHRGARVGRTPLPVQFGARASAARRAATCTRHVHAAGAAAVRASGATAVHRCPSRRQPAPPPTPAPPVPRPARLRRRSGFETSPA